MEKVVEDHGIMMETDKEEIKYRGIKAMPFVIGNEAFEKLGSIGTSSNLIVYLTTVFGLKSITATNLVNIFNGSSNFATLIGAFLSDTYFGRYKTLAVACLTSLTGMMVLTLTAAIPTLHPCTTHHSSTPCTTNPTAAQLTFLIFALLLMIIGAGGIRPCNLAFGAEQFNPKTESGKRGIVSFFNWYYFTFTFAMMVSMTLIVYVQSNISWSIGLAIPAFLMFIACALFFMGTKLYVRIKPEGSPLVAVVQVPVAAFRKRSLNFPPCYYDEVNDSNSMKTVDHDKDKLGLLDHVPTKSINSKLPLTDQFRFLSKASIITKDDRINPDGSSTNPWRLCSIQQVEESKCIARILPIWFSGIIYYIVQVILQNYVVFQALQSNRHISSFQIPAASYNFFTMLGVTIWIPIYDRVIVPFLRTITGKESGITILQKIGFGMILNVIAMLISAYVEHERRTMALRNGSDVSRLSAMWLVPQLVLVGVSEAFTMVGLVEFYYKQVPENMRSIGGSIFFAGMGLSSYLGSFLLSVVQKVSGGKGKGWVEQDLNEGRLDYFYFLIAGIEFVNVVYFLGCAKWYRYRGNDVVEEIVISGGGDSGKKETDVC